MIKARKDAGLPQEDAGPLIGKSVKTLSFYENDRAAVPNYTARQMAEVYRVSYDFLNVPGDAGNSPLNDPAETNIGPCRSGSTASGGNFTYDYQLRESHLRRIRELPVKYRTSAKEAATAAGDAVIDAVIKAFEDLEEEE